MRSRVEKRSEILHRVRCCGCRTGAGFERPFAPAPNARTGCSPATHRICTGCTATPTAHASTAANLDSRHAASSASGLFAAGMDAHWGSSAPADCLAGHVPTSAACRQISGRQDRRCCGCVVGCRGWELVRLHQIPRQATARFGRNAGGCFRSLSSRHARRDSARFDASTGHDWHHQECPWHSAENLPGIAATGDAAQHELRAVAAADAVQARKADPARVFGRISVDRFAG